MLHLATADGTTVQLHRTVLTAHSGDHRGHAFRIDDVIKLHGRHLVVASRKHRTGRHTIKVAPEVFKIVITEIEEISRKVWSTIKWAWLKIDEGLYMGTAALIPLAYFEHYDLADKIVEFFSMIF